MDYPVGSSDELRIKKIDELRIERIMANEILHSVDRSSQPPFDAIVREAPVSTSLVNKPSRWARPELVTSSYEGSTPAQDAALAINRLPPAPKVMQDLWHRLENKGMSAPAPRPRGQALLELSGQIKQASPNEPQMNLQTEDGFLENLIKMTKLADTLSPFYFKNSKKPTVEEQEALHIVGGELCKTLGVSPGVTDTNAFPALVATSKVVNRLLLNNIEVSGTIANGMALFISFKNQLAAEQHSTQQILAKNAGDQTNMNLDVVNRMNKVTDLINGLLSDETIKQSEISDNEDKISANQKAMDILKDIMIGLGVALGIAVVANIFTLGALSGAIAGLTVALSAMGLAMGGLAIANAVLQTKNKDLMNKIATDQTAAASARGVLKGMQADSQFIGTMCSSTTQMLGNLIRGQVSIEATAGDMFKDATQSIRTSSHKG